MIQLRRDRNTE